VPRYLFPEYHEFEYIATAPWPAIVVNDQLDWVQSVDTLEMWLKQYIGSHYSEWAYHNGTSRDYWQACVAFRKPAYKTLFLLRWT
jgi:hypothetical protein